MLCVYTKNKYWTKDLLHIMWWVSVNKLWCKTWCSQICLCTTINKWRSRLKCAGVFTTNKHWTLQFFIISSDDQLIDIHISLAAYYIINAVLLYVDWIPQIYRWTFTKLLPKFTHVFRMIFFHLYEDTIWLISGDTWKWTPRVVKTERHFHFSITALLLHYAQASGTITDR